GRSGAVGPLADVYSLGAILYELLTGRAPFFGETPLDTLVQVIEGEPVRPSVRNPQVPRALETICLKCLEKVPQERYQSAAALADDLERYLKGEEIEARAIGLLGQVRRWTRREPALASRLIVLAFCCLVIQVNYHIAPLPELWPHLRVMLLFG